MNTALTACRFYNVNNITLHVAASNNTEAPTVLFLYGFPEGWHSWRKQTDFFAQQGYHVVAPDQRGYNKSSKPTAVKAYRLTELTKDIYDLIKVLNTKQVFIVSHDWGGIVAWALLKLYPTLFIKAVFINAPYLPSYRRTPKLDQLRRSWYIFFFQLPWLPEWLIKRNNYSMLTSSLQKTSLPGTFGKQEIEEYKEAWQHGSITGMLNWYRALMRYGNDAAQIFGKREPVTIPVLLLWGEKDAFLRKEAGVCPEKHCTHFSIQTFADATHWLQAEKSEIVNEAIIHFFKA